MGKAGSAPCIVIGGPDERAWLVLYEPEEGEEIDLSEAPRLNQASLWAVVAGVGMEWLQKQQRRAGRRPPDTPMPMRQPEVHIQNGDGTIADRLLILDFLRLITGLLIGHALSRHPGINPDPLFAFQKETDEFFVALRTGRPLNVLELVQTYLHARTMGYALEVPNGSAVDCHQLNSPSLRTGALTDGRDAWQREAQPVPGAFVVLGGPADPPIVFGVAKRRLTDARYDVVKALALSGPSGLSGDDLTVKSGRGGAVNVLKSLARSDPDWGRAIILAGQPNGRYRICQTDLARG